MQKVKYDFKPAKNFCDSFRYPNQINNKSLIFTSLKERKEEPWEILLGLNSLSFLIFLS